MSGDVAGFLQRSGASRRSFQPTTSSQHLRIEIAAGEDVTYRAQEHGLRRPRTWAWTRGIRIHAVEGHEGCLRPGHVSGSYGHHPLRACESCMEPAALFLKLFAYTLEEVGASPLSAMRALTGQIVKQGVGMRVREVDGRVCSKRDAMVTFQQTIVENKY